MSEQSGWQRQAMHGGASRSRPIFPPLSSMRLISSCPTILHPTSQAATALLSATNHHGVQHTSTALSTIACNTISPPSPRSHSLPLFRHSSRFPRSHHQRKAQETPNQFHQCLERGAKLRRLCVCESCTSSSWVYATSFCWRRSSRDSRSRARTQQTDAYTASLVVEDAHTSGQRELQANQKRSTRSQPEYCMRGGKVSQHWRLLGRRRQDCGDSHHYAHGRYLYKRLQILLGQDKPKPWAVRSS